MGKVQKLAKEDETPMGMKNDRGMILLHKERPWKDVVGLGFAKEMRTRRLWG